MEILISPSGSSGIPPFTISEPSHTKIVGNWLRGDMTVGNAATVGMTAVIGVVISVTEDTYTIQTNDAWITALVPGTPGDIIYLKNDGTMGTTPGTHSKGLGIRVPGGLSIDVNVLGTGYIPIQDNLDSDRLPLATDDSASGYSIGSKWFVFRTGYNPEVYICMDTTLNNAIWILTTFTVDELGSMALQSSSNVSITGGSISGTSITVGTGCTLDVSNGTLTLANGQIPVAAIATTEQWIVSAPAPTSTGIKGQRYFDNIYTYECVDTDTWVRHVVETSWT